MAGLVLRPKEINKVVNKARVELGLPLQSELVERGAVAQLAKVLPVIDKCKNEAKAHIYEAERLTAKCKDYEEKLFHSYDIETKVLKHLLDRPFRKNIQHLFCQHCRALQKVYCYEAGCWYNPLDREATAFCAANEDAANQVLALFREEEEG